MLSIDCEIGIQGRDDIIFKGFGHANDTGAGQRHWRVPVFSHQRMERLDVVFEPERQFKGSILAKSKQRILGSWEASEKIDRFGEHRLANNQRRVKLLDVLRGPMVEAFRSIEKGDERSGINDGLHRARSP